MSRRLQADFKVTNWDEVPFDEGVGVSKVTSASVTKEYSGGVEGTSATQWLMVYAPDKSAIFVGVERIRGVVDGRHGTLVLQHVGRFTDGVATADVTIVAGTDELKGATGSGTFRADPAGSVTLSFDVDAVGNHR